MDEFVSAGPHMPIVFAPGQDVPSACFLVGLRNGRNALVDETGRWLGDHVPAYVRRYPLMMGEVEGRDPIVCIDQTYVSPHEGDLLFASDGAESQRLKEHISLLSNYYHSAQRSQTFCKALVALDLLRSVTIEARWDSGERLALHGYFAVAADRLQALSDEQFIELRQNGFLEPIYAHMHSLASVERIRRHA
jgi:hypothetical protein